MRATATFLSGKLVRVLNTITDTSGHTSLSIPTSKSIDSDTVTLDLLVTPTGFTDTAFSIPFTVIYKNIGN